MESKEIENGKKLLNTKVKTPIWVLLLIASFFSGNAIDIKGLLGIPTENTVTISATEAALNLTVDRYSKQMDDLNLTMKQLTEKVGGLEVKLSSVERVVNILERNIKP